MILIDTNSLVVLLLGLMNPDLINRHPRTSIYDKEDFVELLHVIKDFNSIVVLPNIWTEVDNLLNDKFSKGYKDLYIQTIINLIRQTSERYFASKQVEANIHIFRDLGVTDTLILSCAKSCEMLITSDSSLANYAMAHNIKVYDMKGIKNQKFR